MDGLLVELRAAAARLVVLIERDRDLLRLNLLPGTADEVQSHLTSVTRRHELLLANIATGVALLADCILPALRFDEGDLDTKRHRGKPFRNADDI